jgi:hypothetical protein
MSQSNSNLKLTYLSDFITITNRAKLLIRVETAVNSMDQLGDNGGNIYPLALNLKQ